MTGTPGIVALIRENQGVHHGFRYDGGFDRDQLLAHEDQWKWTGDGELLAQELRSGWTPQVADVEYILIRMHVLAGAPLANSHGSGQWNAPAKVLCDTVARLALDKARLTMDPTVEVRARS